MLTIKLLNESFLEAIKGRWIKSISGVYYFKYIELIDDPYRRESRKSYVEKNIEDQLYSKYKYYCFYEIYSDFEAYKKLYSSFDYSKLITHETVDDLDLIRELDGKQKTTEKWAKTDPVKFITDNINILFDNIEIIRGNLRYYYSDMPATGFYGRYGQTLIPIGLLLDNWVKGNFMQKCSSCGADSFSIYISPNKLKYPESEEIAICPSCRNYEKTRTMRRDEWMDLRDTVYQKKNKIRTYRFDTVVQDLIDISSGTVISRPNVLFADSRRLDSNIMYPKLKTDVDRLARGEV